MIEYLDLTIDELLLDQENPRLGAVDSQSEALEAIIKLNHSHFRALMVSIKENGLDPGDSLYVIQADDKRDYIVLEGNRRLSAMKILVNPDILDGIEVTSAVKNSLVKVALDFNRDAIEPIRCVLFRNREEAHDWIYRRHTGAAEGEGRINWGPMEIQRFSGDRSILDVIEFVGRNADYSDDEWASTKSMIESRKSSNLARLLESAAGRKHLGIAIVKSESEIIPMLMSDPKWALGVLKHIIEDVRDGIIDSRALNKASDIANYFESLPGEFQPKSSKKALTPCAFRDIFIKGAPKEKVWQSEQTPLRRQLLRVSGAHCRLSGMTL